MSSEKQKQINDWYHNQGYSIAWIANKLKTSPFKLKKEMVELGIPIKDKSQAQKDALKRTPHPTKGKKRSQKIKDQIARSRAKSWENLSDKERQEISNKHKEEWNNRDAKDKERIHTKATKARLQTLKDGSRLERFLHQELQKEYNVQLHAEHKVKNDKLHFDLFLPREKTVIEIDGPSHFLPIWGVEELKQTKAADRQKNGLVIGNGWRIIRIRFEKTPSTYRSKLILEQVLNVLEGDFESKVVTLKI